VANVHFLELLLFLIAASALSLHNSRVPELYAPSSPPPLAAMFDTRPVDGSTHFAHFVKAGEEIANYVAERVIAADVETLDEVVDRLLADDHYRRLYLQLMSTMPWAVVRRLEKRSSHALTAWGVPPIVEDRVALALRIEQESARSFVRMTRYIEPSDLAELDDMAATSGPAPLSGRALYDAAMPHKMRAAAIASSIGQVCGFALASERITSNRLADALVERWLHGARASLGVITALLRAAGEQPEIDPVVLPRSYHLDLEAMADEHAEAQRGLAIALDELDRTGLGYPVEER
jgi:hypothetical protein